MKIEGLSSNALEPSAHPSGSSRTLKNNKYSASIIMQAEKLFNTIRELTLYYVSTGETP
jgi:hypothetical protein